MKIQRHIAFALLLLCLNAVFVTTFPAAAQPRTADRAAAAPQVRKIDPPNWWINFAPNLTLLLSGENLSSAQVETSAPGVTAESVESSANGHYLFVTLHLASNLPAATISLQLTTPAGSTTIQLPILARADPSGHFEGFDRNDVIYLIMPDRFADGDLANDHPRGEAGIDRTQPKAFHGGDIRGVRQHLDYLHNLGVNTLWLTPVWKNADSDYHGYHVVDFYALDDHMGSMQEYQRLVADAHKLGMKVLIDYVVNHTGPHHPWAEDPPTPTWLHGTAEHHLEPSYKFDGLVDPHASPSEYIKTLDGWFANKLPDLNPDDPKLAVYLAQNALWWTEIAQLDGFRLDTFPYSTRQFWSGWHERLHRVYPQIDDVGEVADGDATITSFFQGGRKQFDGIDSGLSTVFDFPLESVLRDVIIKDEPMQELIDVLRHDDLYPNPELLVTFLGNHDKARFISEKDSSPAKLKAAFSLLLTLRGIPQIYSGDEIGLPGGEDPDNRHDFPGGFPNDKHNAFTARGRTPEQQDIFKHVQLLLALRKNHPALRTGKQWHIAWDDNYYAFLRELPADAETDKEKEREKEKNKAKNKDKKPDGKKDKNNDEENDRVLVVYNNAPKTQEFNIPVENTPLEAAKKLQPVFGDAAAEIVEGKIHLSLPAKTMAAFAVK